MPLKPNARLWTMQEQIISDDMTGMILQFEMMPDGEPRLKLFSRRFPFGNREICFTPDGLHAGAGTALQLCRPSWMTEIEPGER